MNNSKEVIILAIMILVVLVSAVKAEETDLNFMTEYAPEISTSDFYDVEEKYNKNTELLLTEREPTLEVGLTSTSSQSNLEEDFGLIVTLKTPF